MHSRASGGARPDAGKGLAMNRPFADQVANRVGAEIDIAQRRIAAHGQRRVACWRKAQAGLVSPVVDERFEMLTAATLFMSFCEASEECQERILRRSSQRFSTTRNHPGWRRVSRPQTEHGERFVIGLSIGVLLTSSQALTGSGQESLTRALVEGDGQHPLGGVKTEREVRGAGVAEPEMSPRRSFRRLPSKAPLASQGQSFRQE
jgi:hypothetical protein